MAWLRHYAPGWRMVEVPMLRIISAVVVALLAIVSSGAGAVVDAAPVASDRPHHSVEYDYDSTAYVALGTTIDLAGLVVFAGGPEGAATPSVGAVGRLYDLSRSLVAPGSALDDVLPNSGPIPQSLGAASRAEQLARKLNLNVNSPTTRQVLNSLDTDVSSFVSQYRKGSIWRELPGEVAEMSVEDALRHSSTVRKLLIDNRFVK